MFYNSRSEINFYYFSFSLSSYCIKNKAKAERLYSVSNASALTNIQEQLSIDLIKVI